MVALVSTIASLFLPMRFAQCVGPLLRLSKKVTKKYTSIPAAMSAVQPHPPQTVP
jgi:hypothetical protein